MRIRQVKAAFKSIFHKTFVLRGRTSRIEYWYFVLGIFAWTVVLELFIRPILVPVMGYFLVPLFWLAAALPLASASVRRFHDTNRSGLLLLLFLIGYGLLDYSRTMTLGANLDASFRLHWLALIRNTNVFMTIYLLYLLFRPGSDGMNSYGDKPLDEHLRLD